MRHRFLTADVFTDRPFGGNPLAVFPDARAISAERMLQVSREFNLSETVFVLPPEDPRHTRRLRIFTPAKELPFAGHPTVGTAHVLAAIAEITLAADERGIVLEEEVGPAARTVRSRGGVPVFAQLQAALLPVFGPPPPPAAALAEMLSLAVEDLGGDPPTNVSCGLSFLFVPLRDRDAVRRARARTDRFEALFPGTGGAALYLVAPDPEL